MGKWGIVNKIELAGLEYVIAHAKEWFQIVGWFNFIEKFSGHNYGVARAFAKSFHGNRVKIENLVFDNFEKFISKATGLLLTR